MKARSVESVTFMQSLEYTIPIKKLTIFSMAKLDCPMA